MPDQYTNPDIKPCAGTYSWQPPTSPDIGSLNPTKGFDSLVIDRGAFRNLYYNSKTDKNVIITVNSENLLGGEIYSPIRNSTRPLTINKPIRKANNNNVVLAPNAEVSLYKLSNFTDAKNNFNVSSIELEYDLSFWIGDQDILKNISSFFPSLTEKQKQSLANLVAKYAQSGTLSGESINIQDFVTGLSPNVVEIWSGNQVRQLSGANLGFQLTRVSAKSNILDEDPNPVTAKSSTNIDTGVSFNKVTVKFGSDDKNRDAYPKLNDILLRARDLFLNTSLVLVIKSIKIFAADRVNLQFADDKAQLPASAIGYSLYINGNFFPALQYASTINVSGGTIASSGTVAGSGFFTWPDGKITANNIHVKIYSPDSAFNTPGFAHSLNLHLSVLSFSVFGPLGDALGAGALPYFGVIIGPTPFLQQFIFYGTSKASSTNSVTLAFGQSPLRLNQGTYSLLIGGTNATVAQNIPILSYLQILNAKQDFYNIINNINIIEQDLDNQTQVVDNYKLRFVNQFGQTADSNSFSGSNQLLTTYFNAYDDLPNARYDTKQLVYNSFVSISNSKNRLYDLFTKSKPLVIFKLNTQTYVSSLYFQSGFISSTINSFVEDPVGILETKLVYRIYAVNKSSAIYDPNAKLNNQNTFKITTDPATNKNYLSIEKFDNTWTFDNVLTSGGLENTLTSVNSEVFVSGFLPDKNKTINNNILNGASKDYDFYCAIYAISTLNDDPTQYSLDQYTSLDFPMVHFSITSDFVLLLPFFYTISYQNGGFIRPQRDLGYIANYNDKDTNTYIVYDKYYGGKSFDNKNSYSGKFNLIDGFDGLLVCDFDSTLYPGVSTAFSVTIPPTKENTNEFTEVDFVILSEFNLQNVKISDENGYNVWNVTLDADKDYSNIDVKFEIDLIGADYQSLIKVVSSNFVKLTKITTLNREVLQSFYFPASGGTLLLRLYFKNTKSESKVQFSNVQFKQNSIKLFSYSYKEPGSADYGFYEDLPLQPTGFIGACNQFAMWLDLPSSGYTIFDASPTGSGLPINGALYSSTWALPTPFPKGMEVITKGTINDNFATGKIAHGVTPYKIFIRTGKSVSITSIDTKRHGVTNLIVTVTNALTSTLQNGIWQIVSEAYPRYFTYGNYMVTIDEQGNLQNLVLTNPSLYTSSEMLVLGQSQLFADNDSLALFVESPGSYALQSQNVNIINPISVKQEQKLRMKYCIFTAFAYSDNKIYALGIMPGGNLIYSETSTWDQTQALNISLIEGNPKASEITGTEINVFNDDNYNGLVSTNCPAIAKTNSTEVIVFYIYSASKKLLNSIAIYARVITANAPRPPVLLFDFQSYLKSAISKAGLSSFALDPINQLSIYTDEFTQNLYHLVFDCSNKVFIMKILYSFGVFNFVDVAMILGTYKDKKTSFEKVLYESIVSIGNIIVLNLNEKYENPYQINLSGSQKLGIVDYDGFFMGVQFLSGQLMKEIVFEKSLTVKAELRTIGVKPG